MPAVTMFWSRKRTTVSLFCQQPQNVSLLLRSSFGRLMTNQQRCFICNTTAVTTGFPSLRHFDVTNNNNSFTKTASPPTFSPGTRLRRPLTTNVAAGRNGSRNNNSRPVHDDPTVIPSQYEHPSQNTNHHRATTTSEIVTNLPPSSTSSSQKDQQQQQLTHMTAQFLQHGVDGHPTIHDPMMRDQQTVTMIQNLLESWIQYYNKSSKNTKSQQRSKDLSLRFITILFQKWFHCYSQNRQHAPIPNRHISSHRMMHYLYRILYLLQQESKQQYYYHKQSSRGPNVSNATKSRNHTYIQRSFQLLQTLYQYSTKHEESQCHPTPKAYSMVLETLSYYHISASDDDDDDPSDATWNTRTIVGRADELMKQLHELYNRHRHHDHHRRRSPPLTQNSIATDNIRVAQNSYLRLLARCCCERRNRPVDATMTVSVERVPNKLNLAKKAEDYLWKHVQPQPMKSITPLDGMKSYSAVLQAYVNQNAPDQACEVLNRMVHHGIRPDLVCYNICLQALGNAGHATQAHDLLLQMIQLSREDTNRSANHIGSTNMPLLQPPDVYSYLAVIKSYAKCYDVTNVIRVFEQMIQNDIIPNEVIYITVLDVLAHQPNSGPLVEEMLLYLERLHYGNTGNESHESTVTTGTTANATSFVKPSREAYTIAVRSWGKTTNDVNAPDRATNIFHRMKRLSVLHQDEEKVEGTSSDVRVGSDSDRLSPNTISYTTLIQAWAQSDRRDAPNRALHILRFMEQQQEIGAMPDTMTYNVVLHAMARHGLAIEAHQLLNEMIGRMMHDIDDTEKSTMYPNQISWATVIQSYINSKGSNTGMKSNDLLLELEHLYDTTRITSLQPSADIYSMAILAQISGDRVDVAEQLFWQMMDRYQQNSVVPPIHQVNNIPPNTFVCNALLHFWSRSHDPVAPQRAEMILRWMEDHTAPRDGGARTWLSVAPNQDSYQYVLRTWHRSKRRNAHVYIQKIQRKMQKLTSTAHVK